MADRVSQGDLRMPEFTSSNAAERRTFRGEAFTGGVLNPRTGTAPTGNSPACRPAVATLRAKGTGGSLLNDALQEPAGRQLAQHTVPIGKIMVKLAAARTTKLKAFFALLAEAIADPAARA